jgi:hypothetical protein
MEDQTDFGDVGLFYGNGNVYVVGKSQTCVGNDWGFNVERLKKDPGKDYFISSEVVVGIGNEVLPRRAVNSLRKVIRLIKKRPSP